MSCVVSLLIKRRGEEEEVFQKRTFGPSRYFDSDGEGNRIYLNILLFHPFCCHSTC